MVNGALFAGLLCTGLGGLGGCSFRVGTLAVASTDSGALADLGAVADLAPAPDPCGAAAGVLPPNTAGALCLIDTPIKIDGKADDWPITGWTTLDSSSAEDETGAFSGVDATNLSGKFRVGWDRQHLYLIVQVTDDVRGAYAPDCAHVWQGDAVELYLHDDSPITADYGTHAFQLIFAPDHDCALTAFNEGHPQASPPPGVEQATVSNGGNWTLEAAVPFSVLGDDGVENGRKIGFDLQLDDYDRTSYSSGNAPARTLTWVVMPTADVNRACGDKQLPFCNPESFGTARLGGR